ncbi:Beta-lactamase HcpA [Campylobacter majalis]|uniref:beta-lactamase n=2 Tax=Campylobacter majalis TaxID=2790656 RepID=A0ABN7K4M5_9BACT|nr:Beta-lactamase HcpA [Campylobacter majalis]
MIFLFGGCASWQSMLSFGLFKTKSEKQEEALKAKCDEKDEISCNNLAVIYSNDEYFDDAKKYYEISCDLGLATACSNLGQIYEKGLGGTDSDMQKATQLYEKSCDSEDGVGCYNMALLLYKTSSNELKEQNAIKAFELLEKSCKFEYKQACFLLEKLK